MQQWINVKNGLYLFKTQYSNTPTLQYSSEFGIWQKSLNCLL
jgi:hypothetical protein